MNLNGDKKFSNPPKALTPQVPAAPKSLSENAEKVRQAPPKSVNNHPKKTATLVRQATSYTGKDTTDSMAEKLVKELHRAEYLSLDDKGGVTDTI